MINELAISLQDILEYDLTLMAGEVLAVINGNGFLGVTPPQRRKLDRIITKYAASAARIGADFNG